jgi:hypothetical protein
MKKLPSQFCFVDHLVFLIRRSISNSVKDFYAIVFEEVDAEDIEDSVGSIPGKEIKLRYEKFCFLKHTTEMNILSEEYGPCVEDKGFHYEKRSDNSTEVFRKIRFLSEEEKSKPRQQLGQSDQSSLESFINNKCVLTQFEQDLIPSDLFRQR